MLRARARCVRWTSRREGKENASAEARVVRLTAAGLEVAGVAVLAEA